MEHSTQQRIQMKAYEIWLREGCPEGSDQRHWEMARKFIAGEEAKSALTSRFYDVHEIGVAVATDEQSVPAGKGRRGS